MPPLDDSTVTFRSSDGDLRFPSADSDASHLIRPVDPPDRIRASVLTPPRPVSYPSIGISDMSPFPTRTATDVPEHKCLAVFYRENADTVSTGSFPSEVATSSITSSERPTDSLQESTRPDETSEPPSSPWPVTDASTTASTSSEPSVPTASATTPPPSGLETPPASSMVSEYGPHPMKSDPIVYQGRQGVAQMAKLSTTEWFRDVLLSRFVSPAHRLLIVSVLMVFSQLKNIYFSVNIS